MMRDVGTINEQPILEYPLSIEWNIENYFQRRPKDNVYYQSPNFSFGRSIWCLRLYPNGTWDDDTLGNVELYLERLDSEFEFHEVSFTLGIKYEDGTIYASEYFEHIFDESDDMCGTDRIASSSRLFRNRKRLAPKNRLHVYIESLVLLRNLPINYYDHPQLHQIVQRIIEARNEEVDSSNSDTEGERNLQDTEKEKTDSPPSDLEGERNLQDTEKEKTDSPPSDLEGKENSEEIQNEEDNSPPSDIAGVQLLSKNLKDLFLNEEECDVTFKVENREFRAHVAVLVARSSVFASMFRHDMSEKNTGIVNVPDCGAEAFKELLLYLYSGTVTHPSLDITLDLYDASVKYDLEQLKGNCIQFMKEDMSIDAFCDILAIALKHNEMKLIKIATEFFAEHIKYILPTLKWQTFMKENNTAANELLMKAMENK